MSAHEFDHDHFANAVSPMDTRGWAVGDPCLTPGGSLGTIESFHEITCSSGSTVYAWVGIKDKPLSHTMPYVGHLRRP